MVARLRQVLLDDRTFSVHALKAAVVGRRRCPDPGEFDNELGVPRHSQSNSRLRRQKFCDMWSKRYEKSDVVDALEFALTGNVSRPEREVETRESAAVYPHSP